MSFVDRIRRLAPAQRAYLAAQLDAFPASALSAADDTAPGLVAFLVGSGAPADDSELRGLLGGKLPEFMIPNRFVWVAELPKTPNGKLDRQLLAEDQFEHSQPAAPQMLERVPSSGPENDASDSAVELEIARIWQEVLRIDEVQANDNFFELGGHSLLAIQILSRVRNRFGVELRLRAVFEDPTVAGLAAAVRRAAAE